MKILIFVGVIALLQKANGIPPFPCPSTDPQQLNCSSDTKIGQTIDSNGCLIWTCVPKQPYCCPFTSQEESMVCAYEERNELILDPKTGCEKWTCVPQQPYCCGPIPFPRKCFKPYRNMNVFDVETGCTYIACMQECEVPMTNNCTIGTKPGLTVDLSISDKCFVWKCVPNQPRCCPQPTPDAIIKCPARLNPQQIMNPETGCLAWECVPKQPYCCKETLPTRKCAKYTYLGQVYDLKTGCLVWKCIPCPSFDYTPPNCLIGFPNIVYGSNGCPVSWGCNSGWDEVLLGLKKQ